MKNTDTWTEDWILLQKKCIDLKYYWDCSEKSFWGPLPRDFPFALESGACYIPETQYGNEICHVRTPPRSNFQLRGILRALLAWICLQSAETTGYNLRGNNVSPWEPDYTPAFKHIFGNVQDKINDRKFFFLYNTQIFKLSMLGME